MFLIEINFVSLLLRFYPENRKADANKEITFLPRFTTPVSPERKVH